jgi:hypothetical protein
VQTLDRRLLLQEPARRLLVDEGQPRVVVQASGTAIATLLSSTFDRWLNSQVASEICLYP